MSDYEIFETQDGSHSVLSHRYGVSYHSKYGAIQETQHVFIEGGFFPLALRQKNVRILEVGFGTGLNALMTMWEAEDRDRHVFYQGVDPHPIALADAKILNYPEQLGKPHRKEEYLRLHEAGWNTEQTILPGFTLFKSQAAIAEADLQAPFDLIYYDAFAPTAQPELWDAPVLSRMAEALIEGGMLVTYCAKGAFKRTLKELGLEVEALKGPPGKREMTRARKP